MYLILCGYINRARSMEMELDVAADPSQVAVIECLISHSNVIFSEKVSLYSVPNFHSEYLSGHDGFGVCNSTVST